MSPNGTEAILRRLDEHGEALKRIEGKVDAHKAETNGRTAALELWRARVEGAFGTGKLVVGVASGVIGALGGFLLSGGMP